MGPTEKSLREEEYEHAIDKSDIHAYLSSDAPQVNKEQIRILQQDKEVLLHRMKQDLNAVLTYSNQPTNNRKYKKYLQQFGKAKELLGKYMYYAIEDLQQRVQSPRLSPQEKNEMQSWINLNNKAKEFLKQEQLVAQKDILFDEQLFHKHIRAWDPKDAIPCFYEQDTQGNKNFFSLNDLINDVITFDNKRYIPLVDDLQLKAISAHFPHFSRALKRATTYTNLEELRDRQEQIMYGLPNYEDPPFYVDGENNKVSIGHFAEKVVEWMFRHFAQLSQEYDIKVIRASSWEDIINKVDLVLQIKNKRTWVHVEKELQLTTNRSPEILSKKREQLAKMKWAKGKDIELIQLVFDDLYDKYKLRWAFGAPVGGLKTILDLEEKELLGKTYERIVEELTETRLQVDLQETLMCNQRSPEARALEKNSKGKIVLRLNAQWKPVIDFPQIGIVGAMRLSSIENSNPEKGIVQGDYEGQYNSKGVAWLTYLTWDKAQQVANKQNMKLFEASDAEAKTKLLLAQLWTNGKEQSKALQTLFWKDFSWYWHPFNKKWTTIGGTVAYLALSEVNADWCVSAIEWTADDANQCWNYQHSPEPFLAFEEC